MSILRIGSINKLHSHSLDAFFGEARQLSETGQWNPCLMSGVVGPDGDEMLLTFTRKWSMRAASRPETFSESRRLRFLGRLFDLIDRNG
jgi:hypothetical protein